MTLFTPGLIGAGVGLLCALAAYLVMSAELKRRETAAGASTTGGSNPSASIIRAVLLADFVVLAALGYYIGQLFGDRT